MKKIHRKIPGYLPPVAKSEIDGKVTDLSSKTIVELNELRDRQLKLLNNKPFLSKLADKGVKIQKFHDEILKHLRAKQDEDQTCALMEKLRLHGLDKQGVQDIEWEGEVRPRHPRLDSDDDSEPEDLLHILSQTRSTEKQVKILEPEKPLITPDDLAKIGEDPHTTYLVNKGDNVKKPISNRGQFKPHKTTKTDVHNPEKEITRKRGKHWEVTAATPPPIIHGPAKVLSLDESLSLQKEHNKHLKEVEAQHATEKLLEKAGISLGQLPGDVTNFGNYREVDSDTEEDIETMEGSDKEIHDEEPEKGGVVFTVMN